MKNICLYFQIHQPFRLKEYPFFDIGHFKPYFDDQLNKEIIERVSENCYLPANALIHEIIHRTYGNFKVTFSISGSALQQLERYAPKVIESFQNLYKTGCVEFLSETENHSLSAIYSETIFEEEIKSHSKHLFKLFGAKPKVFRNTELIYSNKTQHVLSKLGFKGVFTEGTPSILENNSPNQLYHGKQNSSLKVFLRNFNLSDDLAFRFNDKSWIDYPLTASKFIQKIEGYPESDELINLFLDYETFGEHHAKSTGIFEFLFDFGRGILANPTIFFVTPSEAISKIKQSKPINIERFISWADQKKDLSAWQGNEMQKDALQKLLKLHSKVSNTHNLHEIWKKLQNSDHFYYMFTGDENSQQVHNYFNPYSSAHKAYINYMNILNDFHLAINQQLKES